jgi:phenylacetate-CoA ligase
MAAHRLTVLRHYLQASYRFRNLRGTALTKYQDSRARALVEYARLHSPFHRERFAGLDPSDWRKFPEVDKSVMMEQFDSYNTVAVHQAEAMAVALRAETDRDFTPTLNGLTVGLSSGTSGHRGLFLVAPWEQAAWAGVVLARLLPSLRPRGYRVAFFLRSNSNLYARLRSRWIDFRYFDLMLPPAEAVSALNELNPDILAGPPSLLVLLAGAVERGELRIHPLKVVSFAEVLEAQDRERIGQCFGCPVHEVYQCTEGLLAMSCAQGVLHIQEDLVAFQTEPLPESAGEATPVITDLWRRTQPMIRYRMNDVVTLHPHECACGSGFRVLDRIEGRCDDICYFENGGASLRPVFPDTIRRMVLLASPHIQDYQAFQFNDGELQVHLQVAEAWPYEKVAREVQQSVERTLAQYGCRATAISVSEGLVPLPPRAKRRRVQRGPANWSGE